MATWRIEAVILVLTSRLVGYKTIRDIFAHLIEGTQHWEPTDREEAELGETSGAWRHVFSDPPERRTKGRLSAQFLSKALKPRYICEYFSDDSGEWSQSQKRNLEVAETMTAAISM